MKVVINNKPELLALLSKHKDTIRSFGVNQLGLFGSFVSGKITAESDVDFLIDFFPEKKSYDNYFELSAFLEEITGRRIELVTRESLSPYIGPHILKQVENVGI
jgi:predicted nucleotidyltransferase